MFGDPGANPEGWPVTSLAEPCSIGGEYGAGVASQPFDPTLPRYVRITDLVDGGELKVDRVSPSGPRAAWEAYTLEPGDILFARSGATVGKTYLHKTENGYCVFAGYLIRFRPDTTRALPEYIFHFTQTAFYRAWVTARQRVVAQPNINAKQYGRELFLPLPPLALQSEFAVRMAAFDRLREQYRAHTADLDDLFASLQHRAFRGEL
jgi:type I restriction enzyme S subunit